jgi:predicted small secreted protein
MKKLFLGLLVAAFTLTTYSCRETTEENMENDIEEVGNDLEETGEDMESDLEEAGDEIEQTGENVGEEIEQEVNEEEID